MLSVSLSALPNAVLPFAFVVMSATTPAQDALSVVDDCLVARSAPSRSAAVGMTQSDLF